MNSKYDFVDSFIMFKDEIGKIFDQLFLEKR